METPFHELSNLDRLIHEPARLAIMTALRACRSVDFVYLQSLTGLSKGNLSQHLSKLEAAGLVEIEKTFVRKMPRTVIRLTKHGRATVERYWRRLKQMQRDATNWGVRRLATE